MSYIAFNFSSAIIIKGLMEVFIHSIAVVAAVRYIIIIIIIRLLIAIAFIIIAIQFHLGVYC
jgi:hypothetical protein